LFQGPFGFLKHYRQFGFVQNDETLLAERSQRNIKLPDAAEYWFGRQSFDSVKLLFWGCIGTVVALAIVRCIFITTVDLRVDEAYYWTWSKEDVLSYLDHPPLIAWLIRLSTSVFGDTNLGVRFPGLLSISLMQLLLGSIVWRLLRDLRYVVAVVLMIEASLAYGLGMAKITPDVALIPCELAMLWSLIRLTQSGDHRWWLAAGLFGGLALLAKYTAVLLLPAIAAFVLVPSWRKEQLTSTYLWLGLGVAVVVFSPVIYWNAVHDWVSFRFQIDRPAQVQGWTAKFLLDFVGQQFALVGILLLPVALGGTAMLAMCGYRKRDPIPILLSTAVLFPLAFFVWHGLSARIGDSWPLFVWPIAFACAAINLKEILELSPKSRSARTGPILMVVSITSGIAFVAAAQMYYIYGPANYLKANDPIGKEAGFAELVAAADTSRNAIGAKWFATTDYRIYSLLRWHLRDAYVPVVQVNERRRYIGFAEPMLDGPVGLYVARDGDPDAAILTRTSAHLQYAGQTDLTWRGTVYDTYLFQKLTNWTPALSPPPNDPFERAHPH
jgi:4-amino-4-deoxy-L-arabinose transferase-like glycosyltransferase